jgi:multidrug resistance efflux pump
MARAIDLELLQLLEDKLGKETARKVAQAIEIGLEVLEKRAEELAIQKKLELRDELTKELASKADIQVLKTEIQAVRAEMQAMEQRLEAKIELVKKELSGEIDKVKTELEGKIDKVRAELREEILRLDRKFTVLFIILFFTLILFNQNALEFLLKVLGLIK